MTLTATNFRSGLYRGRFTTNRVIQGDGPPCSLEPKTLSNTEKSYFDDYTIFQGFDTDD